MIKQQFVHFQKIAFGGFIFLLGSGGSLIIQFVTGIIVVRAISQFDYGLISLILIFMNILVTLVILGFGNGIPRLIAQYKSQDKLSFVNDTITVSLLLVLITSVFSTLLVYFSADVIAAWFNKPEMVPVLKLFSLIITPFAISRIFGSVFRGIEDIKPKVLFNDLTLNGSRLLCILLVLIAGLGFHGIIWSYIISFWMAFVGFFIYALRKGTIVFSKTPNFPVTRKLISFSMPLLGVSIIDNLMGWAGILMLGYFQSNEEIGLYSAPFRLATILQIPMISLVFLYLPLATRLFFSSLEDNQNGLCDLYVRTTKVAFFTILPIILFFLTDAEFIMKTFFGANYESAGNVLRALTVGFSIHILMGPNSTTLTAFGNTYLILVGSLLACISVVSFCILLVPSYGALGAAISMALSRLISNAFFSFFLFKLYRIQPFFLDFVKPLMFSLTFSLIASYVFFRIIDPQFLIHGLYFVILVLITLISPFVTGSVKEGDIDLLRKIEAKSFGKARVTDWICARYFPA